MNKYQKIVIKFGTSSLTHHTKKLSRRHILEFVHQIAQLHENGVQVVIVSSGAMAAGREILDNKLLDGSMPLKQMFAAVGQGRLMQVWTDLFALYEIVVGQVLLVRDDFSDRKRYLNMRDTLSSMLEHGIIPIINENDAVTTEEIKVGDNDNLSALVANLISADLLVLLTDQQGLFTEDPRNNSKAKLISVVKDIDDSIRALAGGVSKASGLGTGGMITKLEAAYLAAQSGTPTVIASAWEPQVLLDIAKGESRGSMFLAKTTPRESWKRWLLSKKSKGIIVVDRGAAAKLCKEGASLLPVGIIKVVSTFERGAIVKIISEQDKPLAIGISSYSSLEIDKLKKVKSTQIEKILGYSYGPEIVHRDSMSLLKSNGISND
ncbi:MAG: glutamate 5-kinase [Parachlamydiaceae bacterium]|nr:glutamate 5-kinase [Parachlamydiaceae bacterium]